MLLPTTAVAVLIVLSISLIGWGSWASLFKAAKKARFELFYYDFNWGVVAAAILFAYTLGMWNTKDLTFQDNFLLTGYRKMAWVLSSSVAFNLGNVMLLAAVSVSGMAVSFPIAFGIAFAIGSAWDWYMRPGVNPLLAFGGAGVVLAASLMTVIAYRWHLEAIAYGAEKALRADPRAKGTVPPKTGTKGIVLAAVAGVFYSIAFPLLNEGVSGDAAVGPYGAVLLMAFGLFGSSIVIIPFFLNFPVQGAALEVRRYLKIPFTHHTLGALAGLVWTGGLLAGLLTIGVPAGIQAAPSVSYMLTHSAPLLAALWGLLAWREFTGAATRVNMMLAAMFVLMLAGLGVISVAPGFGT